VVDPVAVEAVRQRLEQRHDADSRRLTQAMVDVSLVLDADQRQLIAKRLAAGPRPGDGTRPFIPAAQP
jgi:protein CpxP